MDIVIAGGGEVGRSLCKELVKEGHSIVLIEKEEKALEYSFNRYDISGLVGLAENYDDLVQAGVGSADLYIAVTYEDEINIISSLIAKEIGTKKVIARVRKPIYKRHKDFFNKEMGISLIVNPELLAAEEIYKVIRYPEDLSMETFAGEFVKIHELRIEEASQLDGQDLFNFRQVHHNILVSLIERQGEYIIPSGQSQLQAGDSIFITGHEEDIKEFKKDKGFIKEKIRSVMVLGGGIATYYLLNMLEDKDIGVKVFELDETRAQHLSENFPNAHIIHGDGTDQDLLDEERVETFDAFVAYTGIDEENILSSLRANKKGVGKTITKLNRSALLEVIDKDKIQTLISPNSYVVSSILQFVRAQAHNRSSEVEAVHIISDGKVEFTQLHVKDHNPVLDDCIKDLHIKESVLIVYIIRGDNIFFPSGQDKIDLDDHIILVSTEKITKIDDILR